MLRNPQSKLNKSVSGIAGSVVKSNKPRWLLEKEQAHKATGLMERTLTWITDLFSGWFSSATRSVQTAQKLRVREEQWQINKRNWNRHINRIASKSRMYNYIHA